MNDTGILEYLQISFFSCQLGALSGPGDVLWNKCFRRPCYREILCFFFFSVSFFFFFSFLPPKERRPDLLSLLFFSLSLSQDFGTALVFLRHAIIFFVRKKMRSPLKNVIALKNHARTIGRYSLSFSFMVSSLVCRLWTRSLFSRRH